MHIFKTKIAQKLTLSNPSLNELGLWLLIPFASLSVHMWLPLPPTLLLLFGAIACWIIQTITNNDKILNVANDKSSNLLIAVFGIFILYIFISQYIIDAKFRHYMGAIFAPVYLILILIFSKYTTTDFLKKLGQKFIWYSIIILCIEAILRYAVNFHLIFQNANFYQGIYTYKHNGPMYSSSNSVAIHLIVLLFFIFWWKHTQKQSMKKELTITFVLLLLTFSRTSIPAVAGGLMYYAFFRNLNWKKSLLILLSFGCVAVFGLFVIKDLIQDGSFQTKFQIITESLDYYKTASLKRILFGTGFFETGHIMTYYAHNYFLMFLMETGVFGLLFLLATLFSLIKVTNGAAMIILFPFFIQVSTDSALFIPWFYVAMSFVVLFSTYHSSTHLFSKKQL